MWSTTALSRVRLRGRRWLGMASACALLAAAHPAFAQEVLGDDEAAPLEQIDIGVLATEGSTRALEAWAPTVAFLNNLAENLNEPYRYTVSPHTRASLIGALEEDAVDLILTDPATFVVGQVDHQARAVLSISRVWDDIAHDQTGALVFVRADSDIRSFLDLESQDVMAMAPHDFSGWRVAEQEFRKYRIDPSSHFNSLVFSGSNQREVVYAVQSGLVDAGIVSAGVLESLADQGVLDMDDFAPVSSVTHEGYPFWTSTDLYPEWVMAALPSASEESLTFTINAMLSIPHDSAASGAMGQTVWQAPQNYQAVHDLLISLRVAPYEQYMLQAATRIYQHYKWPIWAGIALILGSLAFLGYQVRRTARLAEERRNVLQSEIRSKQFYRNAIEEHTVFCMMSLDGRISHANAGFCESTHLDRRDLMNKPLAELLTERGQHTLRDEIMASLRAGSPWQGPLKILGEGGNYAWTQCTVIPVLSSDHTLSEIALVASDVTKTREGITTETFNDSLELIDDQVVVIRPRTHEILYCNRAAQARLIEARVGGSWKGRKVQDVVTPEDLEAYQMRCDMLVEGPQTRVTWEVTSKHGTPYEISLEFVRPEEGEPVFIAIYRDITQRKVAEKAKNEFISTVSHELRTPLTSIKGALGLALSGTIGEVPDPMNKMISTASKNCDRLVNLINDILDLQKMEAGKMDFKMEFLNVPELLTEALEANKFFAEKYGVTIRFAPDDSEYPFVTRGDYNRLMQVLDNLLSNACKFSDEGAEVIVTLVEDKNRLRISVRDFGAGIPDEAQPTIFEKFHQADNSDTRAKGGTGLGLAIVRKIVTEHDGAISFISKKGIGTEFFVHLPLVIDEKIVAVEMTEEEQEAEVPVFSDVQQNIVFDLEDQIRQLQTQIEGEGIQSERKIENLQLNQLTPEATASGLLTDPALIDVEARIMIQEMLGQEMLENGQVIQLHTSPGQTMLPIDGAIAIGNASAIGKWLGNMAKIIPHEGGYGLDRIKVLGVVNDPKFRVGGEAIAWASVEDGLQALALASDGQFDCLIMSRQSGTTFCTVILPTKAGNLPEELPPIVVTAQQEGVQGEKGIVSKFSHTSSSGRGKARRMKRA